eukprot:SAG11_NODE_24935_length_365_cov_12.112782_1_plen_63_part_10
MSQYNNVINKLMSTPISKMNKKELYELCKTLKQENEELKRENDRLKPILTTFKIHYHLNYNSE